MLATVDQVKDRLKISSPQYDDQLEIILGVAQSAVEGYCCRAFEAQVGRVDRFDIIDKTLMTLSLPLYPVSSISSVKENGSTVDSTEYYVRQNKEVVLLNRCWLYGNGTVEVTYSGGYTSDTVPNDLLGVIIDVAASVFRSSFDNVTSERIGDMSISYSTTVPAVVSNPIYQYTLSKYRRCF